MEANTKIKAEARYIRVSPQKARLVVDMIRGQQAGAARTTLRTVNIRHQEEQDVADFVENDSREVDHVTMFGRYPEPFQYDSVQPSLRNKNHNGPHGHKTNVEDHAPKQCLANLCDVHRGFSLMSKIRPLTAFRLWEKATRNLGQRSFPENAH